MTDIPVRLNTAASRFEIDSEAGKAVLRFELTGDTIDLQHTSVPHALEGGGYGSALARAALTNHLRVIPTCAFIKSFMKRHPEYDDLRVSAA
jgi:predicted GNAT family acetyltransferase